MTSNDLLTVDGKIFSSKAEAARNYGVNPKQVCERMSKFGWALAQSVGVEPRPNKEYRKAIVIDNVTSPSIRVAARALGLPKIRFIDEFDVRESVDGDALNKLFYTYS
jgi:hypothetical protein